MNACEVCGKELIQLFTSLACPSDHSILIDSASKKVNLIVKFPDVIKPPDNWTKARWVVNNSPELNSWWFSHKRIKDLYKDYPCPSAGRFTGDGSNILYGVSCESADIEYSFEED